MNTAVSEACALGAELSRYDVMTPSSAIAAEQSAVEVSMSIRRSILLECEKTFKVREYAVSQVLDDRVQCGVCQLFRLHEAESVVESVECQDHKSENQDAFQKRKAHSEKSVDPAEHHQSDGGLEHLSDKCENCEHNYHYQCKSRHFQNLLGCCYVLGDPLTCNVGKSD